MADEEDKKEAPVTEARLQSAMRGFWKEQSAKLRDEIVTANEAVVANALKPVLEKLTPKKDEEDPERLTLKALNEKLEREAKASKDAIVALKGERDAEKKKATAVKEDADVLHALGDAGIKPAYRRALLRDLRADGKITSDEAGNVLIDGKAPKEHLAEFVKTPEGKEWLPSRDVAGAGQRPVHRGDPPAAEPTQAEIDEADEGFVGG